MTATLRKQDTHPPSYAVLVDGEKIGEVFRTEQEFYPSVIIWYGYLTEYEFPLVCEYTRREAVAELLRVASE